MYEIPQECEWYNISSVEEQQINDALNPLLENEGFNNEDDDDDDNSVDYVEREVNEQ